MAQKNDIRRRMRSTSMLTAGGHQWEQIMAWQCGRNEVFRPIHNFGWSETFGQGVAEREAKARAEETRATRMKIEKNWVEHLLKNEPGFGRCPDNCPVAVVSVEPEPVTLVESRPGAKTELVLYLFGLIPIRYSVTTWVAKADAPFKIFLECKEEAQQEPPPEQGKDHTR